MSAPQPAITDELSADPVAPPSVPAFDDIQLRAYQLWQTRLRHGIEGTAEHDWLTAELELSDSALSDGSTKEEQPDV